MKPSAYFLIITGLLLLAFTSTAQYTVPTDGLVGLWTGDGTSNDSSQYMNNGVFNGRYAPGAPIGGQAFDLATGKVSIANIPAYAFKSYSGWSVGFWFNGNGTTVSPSNGLFLGQDNGSGYNPKWFIDYGYNVYANNSCFNLHVNDSNQERLFVCSSNIPSPTGWNQLTFTVNNADGVVAFYLNGQPFGTTSLGGYVLRTTAPLVFGQAEGLSFSGLISDVVIYSRVLSPNEATKLGSFLTITNQPISLTTNPGSTALFSVGAVGTQPISYQWRFNDLPLIDGPAVSGADTPTLILSNLTEIQAGAYHVDVSNSSGAQSSATAFLSINTPPTITKQPLSTVTTQGMDVSLSVAASGTAPLSYQWQLNGTNLPSATEQILVVANVQQSQSGGYRTIVTNVAGSATSAIASLTVVVPNTGPVVSVIGDYTTTVNHATEAIPFTIGDLETQASDLSLSALSSSQSLIPVSNIVFAGTGPNRTITLTPSHNQTGQTTVTVTVADAGGLSAVSSFNVTVTNVPPNIYISLPTNGATFSAPANILIKAVGAEGTSSLSKIELFQQGIKLGEQGQSPYAMIWSNVSTGEYSLTAKVTDALGASVTSESVNVSVLPVKTAISLAISGPDAIYERSSAQYSAGATFSDNTAQSVIPIWAVSDTAAASMNVSGELIAGEVAHDVIITITAGYLINSIQLNATKSVTVVHKQVLADGYDFSVFLGAPQTRGSTDAQGTNARLGQISAVVVDAAGTSLMADPYFSTIRMADADGFVTTLAGAPGQVGTTNGVGVEARFRHPFGVALDNSGNVLVADSDTHTIRRISPDRKVTTLAGAMDHPGANDGIGTNALFNGPTGLAVDSAGTIYVADTTNNAVRRIDGNMMVTTFAGKPGQGGGFDGKGTNALFNGPRGLATDREGNIYVADRDNHTIRKITPDGQVSTIAGMVLEPGSSDGRGSSARFFYPSGLAVDSTGVIFVADRDNHTIRRITPDGMVITIGGLAGSHSPEGRGGIGSDARFFDPEGIAVDVSGNLFIADTDNFVLRVGRPTMFVLPTLQLRRSQDQLVLTWPASSPGFLLESTTNVSSSNWTNVLTTPVVVGSEQTLTNLITGPNTFFRLKKP